MVANAALGSLLGWTAAEAAACAGQPFAMLFEDLSAPLATEIVRIARAEGQWHGEVFFQDARGFAVPVYLVVSGLTEAEATSGSLLFLALNYAEQHYALSDQLRRQTLLQRLWHTVPLGVLATDGVGTVVQVNDAARELWGSTGVVPDPGTAVHDWLAPLAGEVQLLIQEALQRGTGGRLSDAPFAAAATPIVHLEVLPQVRRGQVESLFVFVEDRTADYLLEERLRESERFASLGFMAANLAHDINSPLQSLQGALERMQRRVCAGDPDLRELDETITRSLSVVSRIAGIIGPVLDLARTPTPQQVRLPVAKLLEPVVAEWQMHRRMASVELEVEVAPDAGALETDPGVVQQILTNLVINGIQAQGGAGRVLLQATKADDGTVRFRVQDWGPGVPPDVIPHLFTPFFTTKPAGEGTGLGLYGSRALALKLGGWLTYVPLEEPGACFELTLPGATPDAP